MEASINIQHLPISQIALNTGQIDGLPGNPRQWTADDIRRLGKSIKETPELFEVRPIIAYPFDGKLIAIGGNLRLEAAKSIGMKDVPVIVLPGETTAEKLAEIVIKDNGSFGAWDFDALANEWDDHPLTEWGIPAWETKVDDEPENLDATSEEKPFVVKLTFKDSFKMQQFVDAYKDVLTKDYQCVISESGGLL